MMMNHERLTAALAAAIVLVQLHAMAAACLADNTSSGGMATNHHHHLHFFMHDRHAAPGPTAVRIVNGTGAPVTASTKFGDTVVMDNVLTEGPTRASRAVGRAQGTYVTTSLPEEHRPAMIVSMTLVLTDGSTVAVMGQNDITLPVRELAVVGGTGRFRMATGYVLWKTSSWHGKIAVLELHVYLRTA